ncbi:MAG: hypothetical protein GY820_34120 [Gammaproteobacteria bacterium]|nr:hypothetical protein [Gammaproteobacteria bacterium]
MKKLITKNRVKLTLLLIVISVFIAVDFVNREFLQLSQIKRPIHNLCEKAWAHRGYVGDGLQNSLGSIERAFAQGFPGVEIDIFYDVKLNRYIVSHNFPYELKHGKLQYLDEVFLQFGELGYFWLDIKNLDSLGSKKLNEAVQLLKSHIDRFQLKDRLIVESRNMFPLKRFADSGILTSYWISPNRSFQRVLFPITAFFYKIAFIVGDYSIFSMSADRYNDYVASLIEGPPIHLFVVNDYELFRQLSSRPEVTVILTDAALNSVTQCHLNQE